MKIVICGSLKNMDKMEKIRDDIYKYMGDTYNGYNVFIDIPNTELTMFAAQFRYIDAIEAADIVLILPKEITWDNRLYFNQKSLRILDIYPFNLPIGIHDFEYHDHEGITIGESTSYVMAIARHFNKPVYIVSDYTYFDERWSK